MYSQQPYTVRQETAERQERGAMILIGFVTAFLCVRWWWTGSLFAVAYAATQPASEGLGSVSSQLLSMGADVVLAIVGTAIFILTKAWAFTWAIILLVQSGLQSWAKQSTVAPATEVVTTTTQPNPPAAKPIDPGKLNAALNGLNKRLGSVEERLDKLDPPPPPPETLEERLARLEAENEALRASQEAKPATKTNSSRSAK
jgi:hypothetical protein